MQLASYMEKCKGLRHSWLWWDIWLAKKEEQFCRPFIKQSKAIPDLTLKTHPKLDLPQIWNFPVDLHIPHEHLLLRGNYLWYSISLWIMTFSEDLESGTRRCTTARSLGGSNVEWYTSIENKYFLKKQIKSHNVSKISKNKAEIKTEQENLF